jgi:hypothetical protein
MWAVLLAVARAVNLVDVYSSQDWSFPVGRLELTDDYGTWTGTSYTQAMAGVPYTLSFTADGKNFSKFLSGAAVRPHDGTGNCSTSPSVMATVNGSDCNASATDLFYPITSDWSRDITQAETTASTMSTDCTVRFMNGGQYTMCFDSDGDFLDTAGGYVTTLPVTLEIQGVVSNCSTAAGDTTDCITERFWDCVVTPPVETHPPQPDYALPCRVDLPASDTYYVTAPGKLAWSTAMTRGWDPVEAAGACDGQGYEQTHFDGGATNCDEERGCTFPTTVADEGAFTVGLCFCVLDSDRTGSRCDNPADYPQMVGRVFFWTVELRPEGVVAGTKSAEASWEREQASAMWSITPPLF